MVSTIRILGYFRYSAESLESFYMIFVTWQKEFVMDFVGLFYLLRYGLGHVLDSDGFMLGRGCDYL